MNEFRKLMESLDSIVESEETRKADSLVDTLYRSFDEVKANHILNQFPNFAQYSEKADDEVELWLKYMEQSGVLSKFISYLEAKLSGKTTLTPARKRLLQLYQKLTSYDDTGYDAMDRYSPTWNTFGQNYDYDIETMVNRLSETFIERMVSEFEQALASI